MTLDAGRLQRLLQNGGNIGSVGGVTHDAFPCSHRLMDVFFRKRFFFVAAVTQRRGSHHPEFFIIARMGIVACGAHAGGRGRMLEKFAGGVRFMAHEAKIGNFRHQGEFGFFFFMGRQMAYGTAHLHSGVDVLLRRNRAMAGNALVVGEYRRDT